MTQNLGGNVLVFPALGLISPAAGTEPAQRRSLPGLQGIENNTRISLYSVRLLEVDGATPLLTQTLPVPNSAVRRAMFSVSLLTRDSATSSRTRWASCAGAT